MLNINVMASVRGVNILLTLALALDLTVNLNGSAVGTSFTINIVYLSTSEFISFNGKESLILFGSNQYELHDRYSVLTE